MKKIFSFKEEGSISRQTYLTIFCLAMADVLVMAVPFYLKNVISSVEIASSLGITTSQFSQANSIYGWVSLPSYFLGGWLADKISLKKLTIIGLFSVGVICFWYGFIPFIATGKVAQVYIIFALWSFITCFIFWAALWKLLSELGNKQENGKINGIHGSLNGIIGTFIIAIAYLVYFLFGNVWSKTLGPWAFPTLVFIFAGFIMLNVVLIWKYVPDYTNPENLSQNAGFSIKSIKTIVRNKKVWLLSLLILGVYMYQTGLSVFVTYLQDVLLIGATLVVVLGILRTYVFRFIFSSYFGRLADKKQKYILFIIYGLAVASVLSLIAIFTPGFSSQSINDVSMKKQLLIRVVVITTYLLLGITCWALVTNRWATLYVINVEQKDYGMAVGFISFVAFSADAWFWQIDAVLLKNYGTEAGYLTNKIANQVSLCIVLLFGAIGILSGLLLIYLGNKEKNKKSI